MRAHAVLLMGVLLLCGCAKLAHLDQLLTLKAYSDNKEMQEEYVRRQDRLFDGLVAAVEQGTIDQYKDKKAIGRAFGDPVFSRDGQKEGKSYEVWLYRYTTEYFDSQKVYLYFGKDGCLKDWELVVPPPEDPAGEKGTSSKES